MLFLRIVLLAVLMAAATMFLGWISVPVIAAVYALLRRDSAAAGESAIAALLAWGGLLARVATHPAFSTLLTRLGGIFPVPGVVLLCVTVAFAMVLAWSAARIVSAVVVRQKVAEVGGLQSH